MLLKLGSSLFGIAACLIAFPVLRADEPTEKKITFEEHIKPIFREHCTACHSASDKESDLALDSYAGAMAGGSSGAVLAEGNASSSRLFALVSHAERPYMPPDQDVIAKDQVQLLKTWIEQGMPENSGSKIKRNNSAAMAMLETSSLGRPEGPPAMPEKLLCQPTVETPRAAAIAAMAASPWAPLVAVGGQNQVTCYHAESGELLGVIPFPEGEPQSLSFSRDGKQLLIGGGRHSASGCAVLVDIQSGSRIAKVGDELDIVLAADLSPDKKHIALAGPQKIIRIFDTFSGDLVFEMNKHTDWVFSLRYSPDGVLLASGDRSNGLVVWEAETGRVYSDLSGHKADVRSVDFRADSNVLASASMDGTIKLWDMFESKELKSWNAHGGGVTSIAFAQNGLLSSSGLDGRVKLWNGNGELQKEFEGLTDSALATALTGDASRVAGGDWNGQVRLWAADDPKWVKHIAANPPSIQKRIETSTRELTSVEAEFTAVEQTAAKAQSQAADAEQLLTAARTESSALADQITAFAEQKSALDVRLVEQDSQIQQLEQQLAAIREQKVQTVAESEQVAKRLDGLNQRSSEVTKRVENLRATAEKWTADATAATAVRDELSNKLSAAQAAVEKAVADKAELDAQAARIQKESEESLALVQQLSAHFTSLLDAQKASEENLEKTSEEIQTLTMQLNLLQKRVEEAAEKQAAARLELDAKTQTSAELKKQLEDAEQAALQAQEQLKLFQDAYQPRS